MNKEFYNVTNRKLYKELISNGFEEIEPKDATFQYNLDAKTRHIHVFKFTKELNEFVSKLSNLYEK